MRLLLPRLHRAVKRELDPQTATTQEQSALTILDHLVAWEQDPLPIGEWLRDPYHCDVAGVWPDGPIYPKIAEVLEIVFSGDPLAPDLATGPAPHGGRINEVALCWGIGSGKSFLTGLATAYVLYRLGCMRDPAVALGLAPGSDVVITNVSISESQAKRVVFGEISKRTQAPWFQDHFARDPRVSSELRFPKNLRVYPGNSTSDRVLGLNVVMGIIDEAAFHGEVERSTRAYLTAESTTGYSAAVELYHALQERAQSRFGDRYLLMIISSPLFPGDFIQQQLKRAALGAPGMYAGHAAQWEVRPPAKYGDSEASFYIDPVTLQIHDEIPEGFSGTVRRWER